VILGTLSPSKGSGLLEDLLILNAENRGPFEFHFLGDPRMKINPQEFGAVAHGPYNRSDLPALLREINPSLGLIPSLGPETFSLTLSEFWAAGLPVLASNIGVFRERIHATGGGWLIDPGDPDQWYQEMQRIAQDETDYQDKTSAVQAIHLKTMGEMVNDYTKFYQEMERNLSET
jgi:glycosyltransferase involved in cell wall biosynthesis